MYIAVSHIKGVLITEEYISVLSFSEETKQIDAEALLESQRVTFARE